MKDIISLINPDIENLNIRYFRYIPHAAARSGKRQERRRDDGPHGQERSTYSPTRLRQAGRNDNARGDNDTFSRPPIDLRGSLRDMRFLRQRDGIRRAMMRQSWPQLEISPCRGAWQIRQKIGIRVHGLAF